MKGYMRWHKRSAIVMMISALICIQSGIKENMDVHKKSACVMVISGIICFITGYQMTSGAQKRIAEPARSEEKSENKSEE